MALPSRSRGIGVKTTTIRDRRAFLRRKYNVLTRLQDEMVRIYAAERAMVAGRVADHWIQLQPRLLVLQRRFERVRDMQPAGRP